MLFILAMGVLHRLMGQAAAQGLLNPIGHRAIAHQCSLYADDAILFITPTVRDLTATRALLDMFGAVSELCTNVQKCTIAHICCSDQDLTNVQELLPAQMSEFPITYLGMPLSTGRLRKADIEPLVDKIRTRLPTWKSGLLRKPGRLALLKSTLSTIPIYTMISIKLPMWAIKAMEKCQRGFFWAGTETASGGQCTLAWKRVTWPYEYGGLGIPDLQLTGFALRLRWLWLKRTDASKPWSNMPIEEEGTVQRIFEASIQVQVG